MGPSLYDKHFSWDDGNGVQEERSGVDESTLARHLYTFLALNPISGF